MHSHVLDTQEGLSRTHTCVTDRGICHTYREIGRSLIRVSANREISRSLTRVMQEGRFCHALTGVIRTRRFVMHHV